MSKWKVSEYVKGVRQWDLITGLWWVRVQDNGEGWYNWQVSPNVNESECFREDFRVADGGSPSQAVAQLAAVHELLDLQIASSMALKEGIEEITG